MEQGHALSEDTLHAFRLGPRGERVRASRPSRVSNGVVEGSRLHLRSDTQFAPEDLDTDAVLTECRAAPTQVSVELHEGAVDTLL